jgi:hypothetical protein
MMNAQDTKGPNKALHPTAGASVSAMAFRSSTAGVTHPAANPLRPRQDVRHLLAFTRFNVFPRPRCG